MEVHVNNHIGLCLVLFLSRRPNVLSWSRLENFMSCLGLVLKANTSMSRIGLGLELICLGLELICLGLELLSLVTSLEISSKEY